MVKGGRTHLMDAVPVTLGQEFGGYAAARSATGPNGCGIAFPASASCRSAGPRSGTGLNAPPGFAARVIGRLAASTGLPLTRGAEPLRGGQGSRDALVEASGVLRVVAVSLYKICNDLRWMGSGPRAGLGEIASPTCSPARRSCRAR